MKNFGKNQKHSDKPASSDPAASESGSGFYEKNNLEAPLDEYSSPRRSGSRQTSKTRPIRRRENNTRATDAQLAWLVLKIFMVPVLLGAGYFVLKLVVARLEQPSEEQVAQWEDAAALMDKGAVDAEGAVRDVIDFGDAESLQNRLGNLERAQELFRSADALERRGLEEEAVARLEQALRFAPDNFSIQRHLLDLYIQLGNYEQAIPLSGRLLDQDSLNQQVKAHLLTALHETDRIDAGLLLAEQMLDETPKNLRVMEVAAYSYAAKGRTDEALNLYKQILERNATHLLALQGAGTIYEWRDEWEQSLPYYMELLKLAPKAERYRIVARNFAQLDEAGKTVIFLGQAAGLYGEDAVSPWLGDAEFDPVRETVEFRSFADQIVGAQAREAIEQLRRREVQKPTGFDPGDIQLPSQQQLEILRPRQR